MSSKILFLHIGPSDPLSNQILQTIQKRGVPIDSIHVQDTKTLQLLTENSKNIQVQELPCFIVYNKQETKVYRWDSLDILLK